MDVCTLCGCESNCCSFIAVSVSKLFLSALINAFLPSFPLVTPHWVSVILTLAVLRWLKLFSLSLVHIGTLAVIMIFKQIPFLEMTLYPLQITSLCWTPHLSVQTGGHCCSPGSAAAHSSAICPWGRDETPTDTACENLSVITVASVSSGCHQSSQPSGGVAKSFWFYKWQQSYRATAVQIPKDI